MKRIIIICEGETEREFCTKLLASKFLSKEIHIQAPLIKKSMGGIVKWIELKKQIEQHLKNEPDTFVTTFIDYYGLYSKYNFPNWNESLRIHNKNERMDFLENAMKEDIIDNHRHRFLPYIQLHEFEGLLFNSIETFYEQIPSKDLVGQTELERTFKDYDNPEMINENLSTTPSKRLLRIIKGYNKIVHGHYLAEAIGLTKIREKCPRFNQWLVNIEDI